MWYGRETRPKVKKSLRYFKRELDKAKNESDGELSMHREKIMELERGPPYCYEQEVAACGSLTITKQRQLQPVINRISQVTATRQAYLWSLRVSNASLELLKEGMGNSHY
ncbi:hypothetical protein GGTG_05833 [Gaeumannomyces tritici R3-111a-1]|uniref:Uncharacterized protein n=1 Tax=Gaeumannomyces tritici (strain R3-111a-1) TaxID=644352 RepID=J3NX25_GAET3|nr:hypothetical protein GGTG_05833 [Gaeumannomyces tritici R3-111a-1]EJT75907.1 hypothetical protein GGTG_05833 [Gaeumannomyces tritici R3-111a-1]